VADRTYAITHIVGTSPESVDQAIRNGIAKASETLRNLDWFKVTEIRGYIGDAASIAHMQVTMEVGFRYDD
jgi:flavin-binding protein dodecin